MPQSVAVTLNEEPLGHLTPLEGWQQVSVAVPEEHLRPGSNLLSLGYRRMARPREVDGSADDRDLAVMFDAIDLIPLSDGSSFEMDSGDRLWSLVRGWSGLELIEDRSVRWSEGPDSVLRFRLHPTSGQFRLTFSARPYEPTMPQSLRVSLNGTALGTLAIDEGWREYVLTIHEGLVGVEENVLSFEYGSIVRPQDISESADARRLAVLFDAIRLSPDDSR